VADFQLIAAEKRIVLISEFPDSSQLIALDATVFRRIIENLLSNAVKFSPSDSQVRIKIDYPPNYRVRVQVTDSGQGVSPAKRKQIFEKFEIGNLLKETSQIGLGLAFCKIAVEAQGGNLTLESNEPRGSIFTVEL
jgi:K+-sensing histidine kinase KdpD